MISSSRIAWLALFAVVALAGPARAADYPTRPVKWVVPYPPAGTTDVLARIVAQWLTEKMGQPFVVENKPGAGNNIGVEAVVNSPPDGYTMLLVNPANGINATLYKNLNYNFIRDITPVAGLIRTPNVMEVTPSLPVKTVKEFIDYCKANPGKINMASSGNGAPSHVAGALFAMMAGVKFTHVPYRGDAPAITDLLGGQIQVYFGFLPGSIEHIRAGTLRALGVTTATRLNVLPDVPTVGEFVPGYEATSWNGIGAPGATPAEIIEKLNNEINAGLADSKIRARFASLGAIVDSTSVAEFGKFIADETDKWAKVIRFAGIKVE
jgi:tripartite-type tricarboxylate transporter receptor subunit TctC